MSADSLPTLSEVDRDRLKAQRERSNKISKVLGDYLLRGYKMLGITCNKCEAILLQDRQGENYCVGCEEVDLPHNTPQTMSQKPDILPTPLNTIHSPQHASPQHQQHHQQQHLTANKDSLATSTADAIKAQIVWATECLNSPMLTVEQRSQYVIFIKCCYETLKIIQS